MTLAEFKSLTIGSKVNFRGGRTYIVEHVSEIPAYTYRNLACKRYKGIVRNLDNAKAMTGSPVDITDRTDYRNWRLS